MQRFFPGYICALLLLALVLVSCEESRTVNQPVSVSPIVSTVATPVPTPAVFVHGDWQTYTDALFHFRIEIPSILTFTVYRQSGEEDDLGWINFTTGDSLPPAQAMLHGVSVEIFAATGANTPSTQSFLSAGPYPCSQGTPVKIGSGLTAYQQESYTSPIITPGEANGPPPDPFIKVNLETGGIYLMILLQGPDRQQFLKTYGATWRHILASFEPGPAVPNTHPCL